MSRSAAATSPRETARSTRAENRRVGEGSLKDLITCEPTRSYVSALPPRRGPAALQKLPDSFSTAMVARTAGLNNGKTLARLHDLERPGEVRRVGNRWSTEPPRRHRLDDGSTPGANEQRSDRQRANAGRLTGRRSRTPCAERSPPQPFGRCGRSLAACLSFLIGWSAPSPRSADPGNGEPILLGRVSRWSARGAGKER